MMHTSMSPADFIIGCKVQHMWHFIHTFYDLLETRNIWRSNSARYYTQHDNDSGRMLPRLCANKRHLTHCLTGDQRAVFCELFDKKRPQYIENVPSCFYFYCVRPILCCYNPGCLLGGRRHCSTLTKYDYNARCVLPFCWNHRRLLKDPFFKCIPLTNEYSGSQVFFNPHKKTKKQFRWINTCQLLLG